MNSVILHIGFPKTGSTWFREHFYNHTLNTLVPDRRIVQEMILIPGVFEYDSIETKKFTDKFHNNKQLVICEELMLGRLRPGGVKGFLTKEIANRLKELFPNAQIVIFLRNQLEIMVSAYFQYVKSGGNYSFKSFYGLGKKKFCDYRDLVLLQLSYFQYHHTLDLYSDLFSKENVRVFLFEEFIDNKKDFVNRYSEKLGIQYNKQNVRYESVNEGLRKRLIPLYKLANAFSAYGPLNKYYLVNIPVMEKVTRKVFPWLNRWKVFGNKPTIKNFLSEQEIDEMKEFYKISNRILIEKYGLQEIEKYRYPS